MTSQVRSIIIAVIAVLIVLAAGIFWTRRATTQKQTASANDPAALETTKEFIDDSLAVSFRYPKTWRTDQKGDDTKDGKRTSYLLLKDDISSLLLLANNADPYLGEWDIVVAKGGTRIGDLQLPTNPSGNWQRLQSSKPELGDTEVLTINFDQGGNHYFLLFTYPKKDYEEAAKLFFSIVESFFFG